MPGIKIRSLIESTANEEVAHTQDVRGELLARLEGWNVGLVWPEDVDARRFEQVIGAQELYQMAIIGIGEYVAERVHELLSKPPVKSEN